LNEPDSSGQRQLHKHDIADYPEIDRPCPFLRPVHLHRLTINCVRSDHFIDDFFTGTPLAKSMTMHITGCHELRFIISTIR
jgi:hypothetical protein